MRVLAKSFVRVFSKRGSVRILHKFLKYAHTENCAYDKIGRSKAQECTNQFPIKLIQVAEIKETIGF